MGSQYNGVPSNIVTNAPVNISGSTNAANPVITTATPHGLTTGDKVSIKNHQANYTVNGVFTATVLGANTFSVPAGLSGSSGGATGTVQSLAVGATFQIPSDGDTLNAASVNVALETNGDRGAFNAAATGAYKLVSLTEYRNNSGTPATQWATVSPGSTGTYTALSGAALPFIVNNIALGDFVEIQLDSTGWQSDGAGASFAIYYSNAAPGASFSSNFYLPGTLKTIGGGLASNAVPISFHGKASSGVEIGVPGNLAFNVYGLINTAGKTVQLLGDYEFTAKLWRPTGMVQ